MNTRRYPSKEAREIIKLVARIGWTHIGYTGHGHPRLEHESGARYTISATPSDRRGRAAALRDLQRLAGQRIEEGCRKKAGNRY